MNWKPVIKYIERLTLLEKEIAFSSPPEDDPFNEEYKSSITKTKSSDGTSQVQFNYSEKLYSLEFLFQTEIIKSKVQDFFLNHAIKGGKFDYYPSSDELDFETFEIDQKGISFSRPIPSGVEGEFEYNFDFKFRRVL